MRVAWLVVALLAGCADGDSVSVVDPVEWPTALVGAWHEQRYGEDEPRIYVLHPDGRADEQALDDAGRIEESDAGTWRVTEGKLFVDTAWGNLRSGYRLDGDKLSLGLFVRRETSDGLATFDADVVGLAPPVGHEGLPPALREEPIYSHTSVTVFADYRVEVSDSATQRRRVGSRVLLSRGGFTVTSPPECPCRVDDAGMLLWSFAPDCGAGLAVRAPVDPETGLPKLDGLVADDAGWTAVTWKRIAS